MSKNAFSLENLAEAAVSGVRDAAAIVKGFQDDDENIQRMDEFIGAPGASKKLNGGGGSKTLAGALGKSKLKLGRKLGKALGRIKTEKKVEKKVKARGCIYKFGDGDGHYWDRWLTPARSAKYSLPDTGRASKSYIKPIGGFKRLDKKRASQREERRKREVIVENKMLDDHLEYATKNMGHVVHHKMFKLDNFNENKMFSAFGCVQEDVVNDGDAQPSTDKAMARSASTPLATLTTSPIRADVLRKHAIRGEIVQDHKFYEHYRHYEHKLLDETRLHKHKEMHHMNSNEVSLFLLVWLL